MSFCGAPILGIWWCLLWVSKPPWGELFAFGRGISDVIHSLIFTSDVTPADLLEASMAPEPFSSTYLQTSIGGAPDRDLEPCFALWQFEIGFYIYDLRLVTVDGISMTSDITYITNIKVSTSKIASFI